MKAKVIRILACALLICIVLLYIVSGYHGRDFGVHWDESQYVNSTVESVQTGTFLPQMYNYPAFCYWLVTSQVFPDVFLTIVDIARAETLPAAPSQKTPQLVLAGDLSEEELIIRGRVICLGLSALALVWTYLLVVVWQGRHSVALLAAALLGGSFELSYHSRWIASDAVMMQFAVLLILVLFCAVRSETHRREWLLGAGIVFGVAMSVKYTAAFLAVPIMLICFFEGGRSIISGLADFSRIMIIANIVFLLITPGVYVQPVYFFSELMKQKFIYSSGYYGNTVSGVMEHLTLSLTYFSRVFFSHYDTISFFVFVFALFGSFLVFRKRRWDLLALVSAPFFYYLYLLTQKVMVVRNFLFLLPFFCILSAVGFCYVIDRFPGKWLKLLAISVVAFVITVNFMWNFSAADTVRNKGSSNLPYEVMNYLIDHPRDKIFLSNAMRNLFRGKTLPSNVVLELGAAEWFVFANDEYDGATRMNFLANVSGRYEIVVGTRDVNMDYYPAWVQRKILRVSVADARNMNLL